MRKIGSIICSILILACSDTDDSVTILAEHPELSGTWVLVEQLLDPGDGSGVFEKVDSKKTIEFLEDGIFSSKGELCAISADSGAEIFGQYIINDTLTKIDYPSENYLLQDGCDRKDNRIAIHLDGSALILAYSFCFEPCQQKFRKR